MLTEQDCKILEALIYSESPMSAYQIYKQTGISITQVSKRISIISEQGLISSDNGKFEVISILKCDNCIADILKSLRELVVTVYEHHGEPIKDIKPILYYLVKNLCIEQI